MEVKDERITVDIKHIISGLQEENKNLNMAWIDHRRAFDDIAHGWMETSVELVGVNTKIINF
jgi:hypothetical protein